jgi:hypothetical protein
MFSSLKSFSLSRVGAGQMAGRPDAAAEIRTRLNTSAGLSGKPRRFRRGSELCLIVRPF